MKGQAIILNPFSKFRNPRHRGYCSDRLPRPLHHLSSLWGNWTGLCSLLPYLWLSSGTITWENLAAVLPFGGTFDLVQLKGSTLKKAFEHSVHRYGQATGEFLQVGGKSLTYPTSKGCWLQSLELGWGQSPWPQQWTISAKSYLASDRPLRGASLLNNKQLSCLEVY